ncbi:NAD-dependent epimerase/dehydratase family protein [Virgisporangium ochraceum]|uniref:NAD-dependent epimerase n=1 Tax=Virgisporangium ochraceum TaxID=65505 RepID=A0A8J4EAH4_9ACTN|nr:NAD-dependent epimerase/dehydratase family protein [Virgisporangium ochraceum]GIJ67539.1 NAD-dependent epimerase [Virgisporangium ochraceum]
MHVVVGAGAIGSSTAVQLAEAGEHVRVVTRSGSGPVHPGIERVAADASDPAALTRLSAGATAIYNCANPPYHSWPTDWPPLAGSLLAAAGSSGAPLVITGNLYVYGPVDRPMTPDMPLAAPTVKGRVRVKLWEDALAAHRSGRISGVTEVRASDFISPRHSTLEFALAALRANRTVWLPGEIDQPHTFTYTGDVARALIALGRDERAWGRAWHVPSPEPMTLRELVRHTARVGGFAEPTVRSLPGPVMYASGWFNPFMKEMREMSYQFDRPFILDASETERVFGLKPTALDEALAATIREPVTT